MNIDKKFLYFYENGKIIKGPNQKMKGPNPELYGDCTELEGDYTGLKGDCTGVHGNCTGTTGNFDNCSITIKERKEGISLILLIVRAQCGDL